eukprot:1726469-Prymnesium_polylepis.1
MGHHSAHVHEPRHRRGPGADRRGGRRRARRCRRAQGAAHVLPRPHPEGSQEEITSYIRSNGPHPLCGITSRGACEPQCGACRMLAHSPLL